MREEEQIKQERLAHLQPAEELSDDEIEKPLESSRSTEVAEDSTLLRLTIRGKDGKDSKMKVKPVSLYLLSPFLQRHGLAQTDPNPAPHSPRRPLPSVHWLNIIEH